MGKREGEKTWGTFQASSSVHRPVPFGTLTSIEAPFSYLVVEVE
jgi:hypothetical protein